VGAVRVQLANQPYALAAFRDFIYQELNARCAHHHVQPAHFQLDVQLAQWDIQL
jgi:hypothetical protein